MCEQEKEQNCSIQDLLDKLEEIILNGTNDKMYNTRNGRNTQVQIIIDSLRRQIKNLETTISEQEGKMGNTMYEKNSEQNETEYEVVEEWSKSNKQKEINEDESLKEGQIRDKTHDIEEDNVILIYPKEPIENEKAINVQTLIEENIDLKQNKIKIKACRTIRKEGLAIICDEKDDRIKIEQQFNEKEQLKQNTRIVIPKKKNPMVIIYNVLKGTDNQEIVETIAEDLAIPESSVIYKFKMKSKIHEHEHLVFEVSRNTVQK